MTESSAINCKSSTRDHCKADIMADVSLLDDMTHVNSNNSDVYHKDAGNKFDEGDGMGVPFFPVVTSTPAVERFVPKTYNSFIAFPKLDEDSGLGDTLGSCHTPFTATDASMETLSPIVDSDSFPGVLRARIDSTQEDYLGLCSADHQSPNAMDTSLPSCTGDSGVFTNTSLFGCNAVVMQSNLQQSETVVRHASTPICAVSSSNFMSCNLTLDYGTMSKDSILYAANTPMKCSVSAFLSGRNGDSDEETCHQSWKPRLKDCIPKMQHIDDAEEESDDDAYASSDNHEVKHLDEDYQGTALAKHFEEVCEVTPEREKSFKFDFSDVVTSESGIMSSFEGDLNLQSRPEIYAKKELMLATEQPGFLPKEENGSSAVFMDTSVGNYQGFVQDDAMKCSRTLEETIMTFLPAVPNSLVGRFIGAGTMDIIGELHGRSLPAAGVVAWLGKYLSRNDLVRMSGVCRFWRSIFMVREVRKYRNLMSRMHSQPGEKENQLHRKHRCTSPEECTSLTRSVRCLGNVQRAIPTPAEPIAVSTPAFQQVRETLAWGETVQHCPLCNHMAIVQACFQRALCSNRACGLDFCTRCLGPAHQHPKRCLESMKKLRTTGSSSGKKNKKNLKRIGYL